MQVLFPDKEEKLENRKGKQASNGTVSVVELVQTGFVPLLWLAQVCVVGFMWMARFVS